MKRPILIGKAEEIDLVRPDVRAMLENEGLYIGGDTRHPNVIVPFWSSEGKVWSMTIDACLDPERFVEYLTLKGPYTPETPAPVQAEELAKLRKDSDRLDWLGKELRMRRDKFKVVRPILGVAVDLDDTDGDLRAAIDIVVTKGRS